MGRKMRSVISLIVVLMLIYMQQSVIYAKADEPDRKTDLSSHSCGDESREKTEKENKVENQQTDSQTIDDKEKKTEESKSAEGTRSEEDIENDRVVERFEIEIPEPEGCNGYYITKPEVKIIHKGCVGMTKYELQSGEEILTEGILTETENEAAIDADIFREGTNQLHVYMENMDGIRIEEYDFSEDILIDTEVPQIILTAPEGFSTWYQKEAWIHVSIPETEPGSPLESVICYQGNQMIGKSKEEESDFLITQTSNSGNGVNVTVSVSDDAGNKTEKSVKLYIDNAPPSLQILGAGDYMITGQAVDITCQATDDNSIFACDSAITIETPEGESIEEERTEWELEQRIGIYEQSFFEDGIYHMSFSAEDAAGNISNQKLQFIIDQTDPLIGYVDELKGQYMKSFCWNYPADAFIKDFTSYTYQVLLDGYLYPIGSTVTTEGHHLFRVDVIDEAGNRASAQADFVIDHSPPEIKFLNIEDGGEYQLEKTIAVELADPTDHLEKVCVNGVKQEITGDHHTWQSEMTSPGTYYIEVTASDLAGNQSFEELSFEILPESTMLEKMVRPIKKVFEKEEIGQENGVKKNTGNEENGEEISRKRLVLCASGTLFCILAICVGFYLHKK